MLVGVVGVFLFACICNILTVCDHIVEGIVLAEATVDEGAPLAFADVESQVAVVFVAGTYAYCCIAVDAQPAIFFGNDVDDARSALCIVFGRWVGNDLYTFYAAGRHALQGRCNIGPQHCGWLAVYKHCNIAFATQVHIAVHIYRN